MTHVGYYALLYKRFSFNDCAPYLPANRNAPFEIYHKRSQIFSKVNKKQKNSFERSIAFHLLHFLSDTLRFSLSFAFYSISGSGLSVSLRLRNQRILQKILCLSHVSCTDQHIGVYGIT